jgi:hypothetical protein
MGSVRRSSSGGQHAIGDPAKSGGPFPDYREGDVRDVEDELAESLLKQGLASNTDKELTPIDKKTGQRKDVATRPNVPVDLDTPGGPLARQATQPHRPQDHAAQQHENEAPKRGGGSGRPS